MERDIKPTYDELESYVENLQKQLADSQETIAALQARVRELEDGCEMMTHTAGTFQELWRTACDQREAFEQQLTQRTAELDTARHDAVRAFTRGEDKLCLVCGAKEPCNLQNDPSSPCTFEPTPMELLKALQRCNAELEAAKKHCKIIEERKSLSYKEVESQLVANANLHAELACTKGELAEAKEEVKCLDEQVLALNEGCLEYEKLLLALPKVEGEILDQGDFAFVRHAHADGPLPDIPYREKLALLKYRQGME